MDPLSITTGVLTLIAACNALATTIAKLHRIRHVPEELEELETEICALQSCIEATNTLVRLHSDDRSGINGQLSLGQHIKDAYRKIEQIRLFLDTRVLEISSGRKIRKSFWLKWQSQFNRMRQELRDVRSQLGTCISLFDAALSHSNLAQLQEMAMEGRAMQELQLRTFEALREELKYQRNMHLTNGRGDLMAFAPFNNLRWPGKTSPEGCSNAIVADFERREGGSEGGLGVCDNTTGASEKQPISTTRSFSVSSETDARQGEDNPEDVQVMQLPPKPESRLSTRVASGQAGQCRRPCSCRCHRSWKFKTPDLLRPVTGQLLVDYAGLSSITPPCNEHACAQRQQTAVRFQYSFPVWSLVQRVVTLVANSSGMHGPEKALRLSRIRPGLDEVFIQVQSGNVLRLQQLFSQGAASPLDASDTGWTLLHYALSAGQLPTVKFLKDAGADTRAESLSREKPIDVAWNRILSGCLDETSELLLRNIFDDHAQLDERQFTALHKIVLGMIGKNLVDELEVTTAYIDHSDSSGNTPLAWACARGDHDSVVLLLKHGASINVPNQVNAQPIHLAAQTGNTTTIQALVKEGADVNAMVDRTQMTPIHYAAEYQDDSQQIQSLAELGAQIDGRDYLGWTPLHWASWRGHVLSSSALLDCGADVNAKTLDGNAAIMLAVANNSHQCVRLLLEAGADCSVVRDSQWNILHYAAIGGSVETLRSLEVADLSTVDLQHLRTNDTHQNVEDMLDARLEALSNLLDDKDTHDEWKCAWDKLTSHYCSGTGGLDLKVDSQYCLSRSNTDSVYFDAGEEPI
ncbi:MAG: hypothetical protein Q9183_003764 [Haloplaca sp. 2 TL-2023]